MEQPEAGAPKLQGMTRRDFLRRAPWAVAGAVTTISSILRGSNPLPIEKPKQPSVQTPKPTVIPTPENQEVLTDLGEPVIMIDFSPPEAVEGIKQTEISQKEVIIKSLLGDNFISEERLHQEFGDDFLSSPDKLKAVGKKYPDAAAAYGIMNRFSRHGKSVGLTMHAIWNFLDSRGQVNLYPLEKIFNAERVERVQDELGNRGYFLTIEPEPIIDALGNYPNQKVVNFSFQVGRVGFYYVKKIMAKDPEIYLPNNSTTDGGITWEINDPEWISKWGARFNIVTTESGRGKITLTAAQWDELHIRINQPVLQEVDNADLRIKGAYTCESTNDNLLKLFEVCKAFPDKLFITAAGNEGDDLRQARSELTDSWPKNLLLVADWNEDDKKIGKPLGDVFGVDIYANNGVLSLNSGSSFTAAGISALAALLENQGMTPGEIKDKLLSFTRDAEYEIFDADSDTTHKERARVLSIRKIQEYLRE